ncbi:MAG: lysophospholipid acyltransferase family protein [Planctomycetia bacterium]|jgi:lysophospholipid acyltransferase (LPLAT)-like uncharacterized protein|nr:lysophospholipid acyltransferase family protein [Planctomycetia bacterium]
MKRHNRWLVPYIATVVALLIRLWMNTMRVRMVAADGQQHPADPARHRYLYAFWHEGLLAPLATRPKIRVLISQHTDGEVIAQICQRLGIGVIRGSTARGGCQALLGMIRDQDESTHLGITPDGPRGPRRQLKPGAVMIASQSGLPIVPVGIGFVRAWRFGSWDRFAVPIPGSTMVGIVGEPVTVPADLDRAALNQWVHSVEQRLLELTQLAEDWAQRLRREGRAAPPPSIPSAPPLRKSA